MGKKNYNLGGGQRSVLHRKRSLNTVGMSSSWVDNELEYFLQQLELFELEWFLKELEVYKVLKHSGYDQTAIDTLVQRIS